MPPVISLRAEWRKAPSYLTFHRHDPLATLLLFDLRGFLLLLGFLLCQQTLHICVVDLRLQVGLCKSAELIIFIDSLIHECDSNPGPSFLFKLPFT